MNGNQAQPAGTQMYFRFPRMSSAAPFFMVGAAWLLLGMLIAARVNGAPGGDGAMRALAWVLGLWALCMADLVTMAKAIGSAMALMSEPPAHLKPALAVNAIFWGVAKVACLGLLGTVIYSARQAPPMSVILGLGTLLIVPLLGGLWWSGKELKYA